MKNSMQLVWSCLKDFVKDNDFIFLYATLLFSAMCYFDVRYIQQSERIFAAIVATRMNALTNQDEYNSLFDKVHGCAESDLCVPGVSSLKRDEIFMSVSKTIAGDKFKSGLIKHLSK